jgi:hypothetical protein
MKILKIFLSISVFCYISFAAELTLQQGLNGYTGCLDAHIEKTNASQNFEKSDTLSMEFYTGG